MSNQDRQARRQADDLKAQLREKGRRELDDAKAEAARLASSIAAGMRDVVHSFPDGWESVQYRAPRFGWFGDEVKKSAAGWRIGTNRGFAYGEATSSPMYVMSDGKTILINTIRMDVTRFREAVADEIKAERRQAKDRGSDWPRPGLSLKKLQELRQLDMSIRQRLEDGA